MNEQLEQSILQTLAYFDMFDFPLTGEELFKLRITDNPDLLISYTDFLQQIDSFESKNGFYFLPGREEIVSERQRKVKLAEEKMRVAKKGIKKIRWIPFLRAVFVCNTLAAVSAAEESDIDVFIVAKKRRIWLVRLLATLILSLFGLRRTGTKIKNRICLSFYITDNNLNLESIALKEQDLSGVASAKPDIYLTYWLEQLIPVYDPDNLRQSVIEANAWAKKYLSNAFQPYDLLLRWRVDSGRAGKLMKKFLEKLWSGVYGDLLEKQAKGIQQAKMKLNCASRQSEGGTAVVISDEMLKFHEKDRREEYRQEWWKRCRSLGV